jgi:caffeoyl-CoA O-methyltransferase
LEIVNPLAQAYAEKYTTAEDELLHEIADYTIRFHPQAQMLSGHLQGKLLEAISTILHPRLILEIGTFMGYSALCLARGLAPDGRLHTLEIREEDAAKARSFFEKSPLKEKIILHVGEALQIIPALPDEWDLVFIDADKINYVNYYELALSRLKTGGMILADNVLFHGEVLQQKPEGKNARAIQAFNEHVAADLRVETVMLTVRDGLSLIRKK